MIIKLFYRGAAIRSLSDSQNCDENSAKKTKKKKVPDTKHIGNLEHYKKTKPKSNRERRKNYS